MRSTVSSLSFSRFKAVVFGSIVFLNGCGSISPSILGNTITRNDVIEACNSGALFYSASEIDTLITFLEADRAAGLTKNQALQTVLTVCEVWGFGTAEFTACSVCLTAIINFVYGS
jgi:hypothetical protein